MAGSVRWMFALAMLVVVSAALGGVLAVADVLSGDGSGAVPPWWSALLAVAVAVVATAVVLRRCVQRFGGMTGDVLGAVVEVSLAAALVALAAGAA